MQNLIALNQKTIIMIESITNIKLNSFKAESSNYNENNAIEIKI